MSPKKPAKRKKSRAKRDPTWHPRQNAAPRDISNFSTEGLLKLMGAASSPPPKAAVINTTRSMILQDENALSTPNGKRSAQLLTPTKYTLSTPTAGPKASYLVTPQGSKLLPSYVIECNDGHLGVFISENKVGKKELTIPAKSKPWIEHSPIPEADMSGMIDISITKRQLKKVEALVRKRKKEAVNPRGISQNSLNKIPATQAMRKSGIKVEDGDGHYVHFIPFSFLGDTAQVVNNMGIGTRFANAAMELVNPAIRRLLYMKNGPKEIYLSAIPTWVPGFEKIRLLKSITYIIKDGKDDNYQHCAKLTFNTLSLSEVCVTNVRPIRDFIIEKFSSKPAKKLLSPAATKRPLPQLLSPLPHRPILRPSIQNRPIPESPSVFSSPKPMLHSFNLKKTRSPLLTEPLLNSQMPTRKLEFK